MSSCGDPVGQQLHRRDRVVGHAERAGEHVGRAAGQHAERRVGAGEAGGHLVERAVAAEADHDVDAAAGGVLGEAGGVAAAVGLDDLDLVARGQRAVHDHGVARRHRRGERVDDQQDAQDRDGTGAPSWTGAACGCDGWVASLLRGNNDRAMNVVVCVKQIPDPAMPGELDPLDQHPQARRQADPRRVRQLRRRDGAAARRHGRRRRGHPRLDGAERRGLRAAHRAGDGRGQGVLVSDPSAAGLRCADDGQGAGRGDRARSAASTCLAATESTDGYTGTVPEQIAELLGLPSVTFAKHVEVAGGTVKVQRQTEAGYDEVDAARCRPSSA